MRTISLTQGREALVDDEDYDHLMQWKWHTVSRYREGRQTFYARRNVRVGPYKQRLLRMHTVVAERVGLVADMIDHKNGDGLDNQRDNLRPATCSQNAVNRPPNRNNTSGYKGVLIDKQHGYITAQLNAGGERLYLGTFPTKEDAARAYDEAAKKHFGEFAYLNFK